METTLKGMGHFSLGFMLGFILFLYLKYKPYQKISPKYTPLLPFLLGILAALPYALEQLNSSIICPNSLLFYYCIPHNSPIIVKWLNNFYIALLPVVLIYVYLMFYYIKKIKKHRQHAE